MQRLVGLGAASALAVVASIGIVVPASALVAASRPHPDLRTHDAEAGQYATQGTGTLTSFSATVTVPTYNCEGEAASLTGYIFLGSQTGGYTADFYWQAGCRLAGDPTAYIGGFGYHSAKTYAVSPGDVLRWSFTEKAVSGGSTNVVMRVDDMTDGVTVTLVHPLTAPLANDVAAYLQTSLDAGHEVGQFTTATFNSVTVNGASFATLDPVGYSIYWLKTLEVKTTKVTTEGSFKVEWVSNV